ncbi:TFB1 [Candida jiufengensis]|uniref:TFB1 n=1 Tax=Candida jiufengensis TaxID=497108 RepID=UPI0022250902|nr:TFB1 [Candida jiufengensis]KAI5955079.1 TFB1 [Candida jiufengensis]
MDVIRGACSKDKVGGMVYIREDIVPSMLEWKAIEDDKNFINIPLNKLIALQASKETTPKMILQISYKLDDNQPEPTKMRLNFNNRPTMNNIKDALQTIVARSRTRVEGSSTPTPQQSSTPQGSQDSATPTPTSSSSSSSSQKSFQSQLSLSDSNLLKNFELQQKLLLEDKNLRNIFTKSVMNFKLSPTIFWSSRINQLRTFALTISQHRGPYNVLSTIKPVATSDNQVNVNVTRDTINEIFEIYPIIKRAFQDLVPQKLSEGEFWSRFFNSKLFRRLRGDKIGLNSGRGDAILDKYLYMDDKLINEEVIANGKDDEKRNGDDSTEQSAKRRKLDEMNSNHINKFLDLSGNEQDNSQKLGNRPDMTMRYDDDNDDTSTTKSKRENEMIILMKNMNKLSSKMMSMSSQGIPTKPETTIDGLSANEVNEYEEDLNLHDLNDVNDSQYITLNINTNNESVSNENNNVINDNSQVNSDSNMDLDEPKENVNDLDLNEYFLKQIQTNEINLSDTFKNKNQDIEKTYLQISNLIRQNFKTYKLINKEDTTSSFIQQPTNIIPDLLIQEIITYNITIVEFLSHFWKLFLNNSNNSNQLKKIFTSLKNCSNSLKEFKIKSINDLNSIDLISNNEKLKDKVLKDFNSCLEPMEISLDNALNKYTEAVKINSNSVSEK